MTVALRGAGTGRITNLARASVQALQRATARFPITTLLITAFGLLAVIEELGATPSAVPTARLLTVLSGAAAASLAGHLLVEGRLAGALGRSLVAAACTAGAGCALWIAEPFTLYGPILIATCVGAVPVLGMAGRGTAADYWSFVLWITAAIALAFLAVLVFSVGVYAILQMLEYLLDVPRFYRVESAVWVAAMTWVGPLVALGRVPQTGGPDIAFDPQDRFARTIRPLADWVLAPLVLAAAVVIHLYAGRILVTGEVPRGQVGWIVSVYLLAVFALRLAIDPFDADEAAPARVFRRAWACQLVVPLALLGYALWLRVASQGVTDSRYFLGLWWLAGTLMLLAQVIPRWRGDIRVLSAIPLILLLLSTFGPWGVAAVVTHSQLQLIREDLEASGSRTPVPDEVADAVRSRLNALASVGTLRQVSTLLPDERQADPVWSRSDLDVGAVVTVLGFAPAASQTAPIRYFVAWTGEPFDVRGYDTAASLRAGETRRASAPFDVQLTATTPSQLSVRVGTVTDVVELGPLLALVPWADNATIATSLPVVVDLTTVAGRRLQIQVDQAELQSDDRLVVLSATYLWNEAEWLTPTPPR